METRKTLYESSNFSCLTLLFNVIISIEWAERKVILNLRRMPHRHIKFMYTGILLHIEFNAFVFNLRDIYKQKDSSLIKTDFFFFF